MDILEEMAKNGGEKSGSLSKNRSDFQLHFAMCLYFAEYLRNKDNDFQILLDYDDDISLVRDNHASFYQVKTSSIEKALNEHILSGKNSDYITNLYKHVHKLGLQGIEGLFLISNLKIEQANKLLDELSLDDFSTTDKEKIINLIKKKYKIENIQKGFLALTKIRHTEMPLNDYVPYVRGKLSELIDEDQKSLTYDLKSIYACIKTRFDEKNNFEKFPKITNKKNLLCYKGIDSHFLKKLIECAKSNTYNDSNKKFGELLDNARIGILDHRNFITGLNKIKSRILSSDRDTIAAYRKTQEFIKRNNDFLDIKMLEKVYEQLNIFKRKDKYESYALIFLAVESYRNEEDL